MLFWVYAYVLLLTDYLTIPNQFLNICYLHRYLVKIKEINLRYFFLFRIIHSLKICKLINRIFHLQGNKSKKKRKQKKNLEHKIQSTPLDDIIVPELNWSQTSESDFSDSEMGRLALLMKSERKIRLHSMSLLLFIVKVI